ncbi:MAG TPA: hypothetical protein VF247_03730, partial [Candidatus Krumholzibacteria bacterium]
IPRIVSHDVYLNAIVVSVVLVVLALVLIRRALRDEVTFALAVVLLVCCNGFMDFTTAGLENPLAYLVIAFYLLQYARLFRGEKAEQPVLLPRLALAFGLALVTRHDLLLLLLPSFVQALLVHRSGLRGRGWVSLALLALGPLAAWSSFALVYYGSLFPNPALAKLNTGIAHADLIRQGARYLVASLRFDTVAVVVLAAAVVAAFATRERWMRGLALGVLANVAYVVWVGGDFMLGRFLSFAYLVAVVMLLSCMDIRRTRGAPALAGAVLLAYAFVYPHTPVNSGRRYSNTTQHAGIADERGVYFTATSIHAYVEHTRTRTTPYFPDHASAKRGYEIGRGPYKLTDSNMIGFFGYWCGTRVMIADRLGLADPLFARLPVADRQRWRIGHFFRAPVPGYYESIVHDDAEIHDPQLNDYYRKIRLVTQGPIFSKERWGAIVAMNLGRGDRYDAAYEARR